MGCPSSLFRTVWSSYSSRSQYFRTSAGTSPAWSAGRRSRKGASGSEDGAEVEASGGPASPRGGGLAGRGDPNLRGER